MAKSTKDEFNGMVGEVYKLQRVPMIQKAQRRIRNEEVAKDIVQQVFENLLDTRPNLTTRLEVVKYLYRSLNNELFDYEEEQSRERKKAMKFNLQHIEQQEHELFRHHIADLYNKVLEKALSTLSERERTFLKEHVSGTLMSEIADEKKIGIGSAYNKKHRIMKKLRKAFNYFLNEAIKSSFFLIIYLTADRLS